MCSPKFTRPLKITGQMYIRMKATRIIRKEMRIGTKRRPLKNDSALGSSTPLNRLYTSAEMMPTRIPTNWFWILPNAAGT